MQSSEPKKSENLPALSASAFQSMRAALRFSLSSLRGRMGQAIPVTLALLLLIGAAQAIGALHDVSSTLTRQQIAASWRGSADLLVRPQQTVSQPERDEGWINPQSGLENYGGISAKQVASIASLTYVAQIIPFATAGWRRIDVLTPVVLAQKGVYRISAQWMGEKQEAGNVVQYVEVSDLAGLTGEEPLPGLLVQHLVLQGNATSVVYALSVPALQLLVGVAPTQENMLRQLFFQGSNATTSPRLIIHVAKLNGNLTMLPVCIEQSEQPACWQAVTAQTGHVSYLAQSVQLLRYSQARYSATAQQLMAGQLAFDALGEDAQGSIYRSLLQQHLALAGDGATDSAMETGRQVEVLPPTGPEHLPLLPGALQFMPLAQACAVNGEQCYSGLLINLHGVDRYNTTSLNLLQATAAAITARTGLHVDILDGSSTRTVSLVTGNSTASQTTSWRVVGVAVQITHGVDALQNSLFALCSIICLLAIGAAGVLIGIGRRNEARTLEQLGWSRLLRVGVYIFNALLLALPGCSLAIALIVLSSRFWPGNVSPSIMWVLLAVGVIIYGVSLVSLACVVPRREKFRDESYGETRAAQAPPPIIHTTPAPTGLFHRLSGRGGRGWEGWWGHLRRVGKSGGAFHMRITAPLVCGIAISATVFLIAMGYLMMNNLNRELIVTVLGSQVRAVLEGSQLLLILLVLLTALLTVGLCTSLLLRERRRELVLLAKVGWEQRYVLLRLLRDSWWTAALSGAMGALLALVILAIAGTLPPLWAVGSVLVGGPALGLLLDGLVVYALGRQALKSVYPKRV